MGTDSNNETFSSENTVLLIHSMHVSAARIHDLWNLDIIGIHDSVEEKSKEELTRSAIIHFKKNVKRLEDGRYDQLQ